MSKNKNKSPKKNNSSEKSFILERMAEVQDLVSDNQAREDLEVKDVESIGRSVILKRIADIVLPFIIMYGIYIILNGHLSPGGGFSGGAILGAALSLFSLSRGHKAAQKILPFKRLVKAICSALLFYAIAKGYSFYMGAIGLSTGIPKGTPGSIFSGGLILPLNICVGIVVACTIYGLYSLFAEGEV